MTAQGSRWFPLVVAHKDDVQVIEVEPVPVSEDEDWPDGPEIPQAQPKDFPGVAWSLWQLVRGRAVLMVADDVMGQAYGMDQGPSYRWVWLHQKAESPQPPPVDLDGIGQAAQYVAGIETLGTLRGASHVMVVGAPSLVPEKDFPGMPWDELIGKENYAEAVMWAFVDVVRKEEVTEARARALYQIYEDFAGYSFADSGGVDWKYSYGELRDHIAECVDLEQAMAVSQ